MMFEELRMMATPERDAEIEKKEEAQRLELSERNKQKHLVSSGLGKRYHDVNYKYFDLSNQCFKNNYNAVCKFIDDYHRGVQYDLALCGTKNGSGKTALSALIVRECYGLYTHLYDMVRKFEDANKFSCEYTRDGLMEKYANCSLLVVDEVGRDANAAEKTVMFQVFEARYQNCLPTVIVSNLPKTTIKKGDVEIPGVFKFLGNAFADRFLESGKVLEFDMIPSYRTREMK